MKKTAKLTALASVLVLAIAMLPTGASHHPTVICNPTEFLHSYTGAGGVFTGISIHFAPSTLHTSETQAWDSGVVEANDPCNHNPAGHGDGDMEFGHGGGRFPAGTTACAENSHHASGPGAQYWADDETGLASFAYRAGADGPALVPDPTDPCATDGIITNDPTTDPLDCGAGGTGFYMPGFWTPATLGETVPANGACNPYGGEVWVIILAGANVMTEADGVHVYTPISGHIWS